MSCFDGFAEICRADAPLAPFTWYKLGGPARWLLEPRDEDEAARVLRRCREADVPWRVLGRGANVLVRDAGVDGAVVRLSGTSFEDFEICGTTVRVAGGADFSKVVRAAVDAGLAGLERLAGIPGSMGGIVRMNAGGKYGSIAEFVQEVTLATPAGDLVTRPARDLGFSYRRSDLGGGVVVGTTLELTADEPAAVRERFRSIWTEKHATQPPVARRSCGCIFKNPPGHAAGKLLDEAGLKGASVGGAVISPQHANFIVADDGCTAQDVLDLIALARDRVWNRSGVELQLEVEVW